MNFSQYSDLRLSIEGLSGGTNTVLMDDAGLPSIMVAVPKMRLSDLIDGAPAVTHPGFLVNGVEQDVMYISKYMNIMHNERGYSLPAQDPQIYFTYDQAHEYSLNKGKGWHLMTNAMWAAIALWCKKNGTVPHGNTNDGEYFYRPLEKGIISSRYGTQPRRTKTGSGPESWYHNHNYMGIADMVGNLWEWVGGLRLLNGEIQIIEDSTSAMYDYNVSKADSHYWHAITEEGVLSAHGEKNTLRINSLSPGDDGEFDHLVGSPLYDTKLDNCTFSPDASSTGNYGYLDCRFSDLAAAAGVQIPLCMKYLGLYPVDGVDETDGIFVARNYGERMAVRGGKHDSKDRAGLFALHFYNPRYYHGGAAIGFRTAYAPELR